MIISKSVWKPALGSNVLLYSLNICGWVLYKRRRFCNREIKANMEDTNTMGLE
jgi:hypothetical protein